MHLRLGSCVVRDWAHTDLESIVRYANNQKIWMQLRDRFPFPYTEAHGREFLAHVTTQQPSTVWAIEIDGEAAGGIGIVPLSDVERVSAEIGYWLGEPFWGRGIMTEVLRGVTAETFRQFDLHRLFALPFADNVGSVRVLQKAGYVLEGRMKKSAIKSGVLRDQFLFAAYREG